jgi:hypothetical protein
MVIVEDEEVALEVPSHQELSIWEGHMLGTDKLGLDRHLVRIYGLGSKQGQGAV